MNNQSIFSQDGTSLQLRLWPTSTESKGFVCLVHGLGEHCGRYAHVAEHFNLAGYSVGAFDLRGHGQSAGKRGHAANFSVLLDDIRHVLSHFTEQFPNLPTFLYGHSFGGSLVANFALKCDSQISGFVVTSPLFRPAISPPLWKMLLGHVANLVAPKFTLETGIDLNFLSTDPTVKLAYEADHLNHGLLSAKLGIESLREGKWAVANAGQLKKPLLIMHGTDDGITSYEASAAFAENAHAVDGDLCHFKSWPGLRHELHNEVDRGATLSYITDWIDAQL